MKKTKTTIIKRSFVSRWDKAKDINKFHVDEMVWAYCPHCKKPIFWFNSAMTKVFKKYLDEIKKRTKKKPKKKK